MANTTYTYDYADFYNGSVNCGCLHYEINSSSISSASLLYVTAEDSDEKCYITFDDGLTSPDVVVLDSLVAAHTGENITIVNNAYVKSEKHLKTNSTKWVRKMSLPVEFISGGIFKIYFCFEFFSTKRRYNHFHVLVDDEEIVYIKEKAKDTSVFEFKCGYIFCELESGNHNVCLEVKSDHSTNTVVVGDSVLSVEAFDVS